MKGNNMKFTKIVAVSLLALSAMQLANAVKFDATAKGIKSKDVFNGIASIGETVEISFFDTSASTGISLFDFPPSFLMTQKDCKDFSSGVTIRTITYEVVDNAKKSDPLIIGSSKDNPTYTIKIGPRLLK